ncbi:MAG: lipoyl synthase, partial [Candidatus Omnitrophica bacterium]|nr:lipoyl synthase [Candidatus Omnitrophota bacterium]
VAVIQTLRRRCGENISTEVLVPDFNGNESDAKRIVEIKPDIFGHNIETVPRLYKQIRPKANYERSVNILRFAKKVNADVCTKSALMLGLGETVEEVIAVINDLRGAGCDMLVIGQYLRPSLQQVEVRNFIAPETFLALKEIGYSLGFKDVQSGPFARSSYRRRL